ncbi:hypothetical protein [Streptomyces sp. SS]|uniref:hypothetical protein n=1 Tax=Streptomyces sp. SS TaxID=260742 RepID=UPI000317ED8C|nr:hypothetical protein [Streptomyces sp. SS]
MPEATADGRADSQAREVDRKGGPGHTVLMALALALPITKVAYTVGGGDAVRDVLVGMEPGNWPDVVLGMVITDPLLGSVLGVVASRVVFALFAARGAIPLRGGLAGAARRAALTVVNPVAVGVIDTCFFGPWWGLATGLAAYALRKGVVVEYRTGRRRPHHGHGPAGDAPGDGYRPPAWLRRVASVEQWAAGCLAVVVLPLLAFVSALDGQSWTTIVTCRVTSGTDTATDRLIELGREGDGVVGWNLDTEQISNGFGCTSDEGRYVREPWWRT